MHTFCRVSRIVAAAALTAGILAANSPGALGAAAPGAYSTTGAWSFVSAPRLHPPILHTDAPTVTGALAEGDFLTANFPNVAAEAADPSLELTGQGGPLILDSRLQPVWFHPVSTDVVATDLKEQSYQGAPALSWWEGVVSSTGATVSGSVYVVDQHYRQVAKLTGDTKDGWVISPHEVDIAGSDAWVTSYRLLPHQDLSAYGGSADGTLYDFAVQEYDLRTGQLLYTWDAFNPGGTPNVSLSQSDSRPPQNGQQPWDAYHGNSVQLVGADQFLVSMRATHAAYLVDRSTGAVVWTLGGNASSFTIPDAARFYFQHTVELLPGNLVSVFDDHCCAFAGPGQFAPPPGGQASRGLILKLDLQAHTASLVQQYVRSPAVNTAFTGSMQVLGNGNALVGWGSRPYFSEYTQAGEPLLDAVWPGVDLSYRVLFTSDWVGEPYYSPVGVVKRAGGRTTIYASWNGATKLARWQVLAGPKVGKLKVVAARSVSGFETAIPLKRSYRVYRVRALGRLGRTLRTSSSFPTAQPVPVFQGY